MKQLLNILFVACFAIVISSCHSSNKDNEDVQNNESEEIAAVAETEKVISEETRPNAPKTYSDNNGDLICEVQCLPKFYEWFDAFQERNPHWTRSKECHNKLISEFKKKMLSDLDFAKEFEYGYAITSECISSYERPNGEYGGIWAHVIRINVKLLNPLYNGQDEVELICEIISTIPAKENHISPYTTNANYVNTFDQYHDMDYDGALNLGTFIITKKS